jgi:hypothetical protein
MKSLLKQLVVLFIGILILSLATCAPVPNQSPTSTSWHKQVFSGIG